MSLNRAIIQGRLTKDPELRRTRSGDAVTSFTLAVDRDFKDKSTGERETDFINCVAWKSTAEFASRYLSKGRMAVVSGRLQIRPYTDKEGNKRTAAEVVAENIYFGDSSRDVEKENDGYNPPLTGTKDRDLETDEDGDLPF